jgi:exonuclease III
VNTFNVSTLGRRASKTHLKIEGITAKKHDVIFLSDCRMGNRGADIERMFGLNRNASYKLYKNSSKEARGVAIAIKRNIPHRVIASHSDRDQNVLLLKVEICGKFVTLGSIYGPNGNDIDFYNNLRTEIDVLGGNYIIGGDFNTILDRQIGEHNMDREGGGGGENTECAKLNSIEWMDRNRF